MDTTPLCPNCGKPLPPNAPKGLCPECVLQAGFPTGTQPGPGEEGRPKRSSFVPPQPAELASLFPQLEILELIGRGGMGAVYRARQPMLDRIVALKILPSQAASDPGFAERFTREARALARLSHPNIVGVHEFGQAGGFHYFVMEFVDGMNLRQLERAGRLTPDQALQIVPQICEALQFAHDEGVVHRDIKPENILIDKRGRVKIADFGIAKILGQEGDFTLTGAQDVVGTPHYMAPEQIEKPRDVDHRADIYSLGVVFYEMLTGELPLGKFQAPSEKVQVDVRLDSVVLQALRKEPERRYQHASEVKEDVETIASGPGSLPPRLVPSSPPPLVTPPSPTAGNGTSDKTILPVFLLALLFGPFGVHRFYVGKIGTGILQLGTLGLCGVWTLIDWILILCSAFTDGQGRRITEWIHPHPDARPSDSARTRRVGIVLAVGAICLILFIAIVAITNLIASASRMNIGVTDVRGNKPSGTTYGSGTIITDTRTVKPFSKIEMHDSGDLDVVVLPKSSLPDWPSNSVSVTTDDNVAPLIVFRTEGDTLTIHSPKEYRPTRNGVKVRVATPYLDSLTTFSSGNVQVTGLDERYFKMKVNNTSDAVLKGRVDQFYLVIMGSGDVQAGELLAKDLKAIMKGSGDAVVHVTNSLNAQLMGSGDLIYLGQPATVQQSVTGSGSIRAR